MGACNQSQSESTNIKATGYRSRRIQINRRILLSRTADRSLLFKASDDCMTFILVYLNIKSISQLDIAVTNTAARIIWLSSLQVNNHRTINGLRHCNGSIRWVVTRGIRLVSLKVRDDQWFTHKINGNTLLGLDVLLLRDISFHGCDMGDEDVIALARDCPYLSEILQY